AAATPRRTPREARRSLRPVLGPCAGRRRDLGPLTALCRTALRANFAISNEKSDFRQTEALGSTPPLLLELGEKLGQRLRAEVALASLADRNGARLLVTIADDQHVRHLLRLRIANLGLHLFA